MAMVDEHQKVAESVHLGVAPAMMTEAVRVAPTVKDPPARSMLELAAKLGADLATEAGADQRTEELATKGESAPAGSTVPETFHRRSLWT